MSTASTRWAARLAAPALVMGGLAFGTATAPTVASAATMCAAPATTATVFSFNDFHGRVVDTSFPPPAELAARLFTPVEEARAAEGAGNVLLLSAGDNIGGSTFVSAVANDTPTLEVLSAAGVDAVAVGNHEFDKGWADLSGRVVPFDTGIPYLGANVYDAGTTNVAAPLAEYAEFVSGGMTIAVIGAVTGDLPTLVSPAGITDLTIGNPVEAINRVAAELASDPTIDVVIASIHEGAASGSGTISDNAAGAFAEIANDIENVDVIFNGHTHQVYSWETLNNGTPVLQAGEYAGRLAKVVLGADASGAYCGLAEAPEIITPPETPGTSPAIQDILDISAAAAAAAAELGAEVVGFANQAVSTPGNGGSGTRNVESPMSNLVAQMFYDQIGNGNPEFIGIQNPGGTRTSFDRGPVTYEEAALVLPFANSLMTTQVTGAHFKMALEQQWQRDSSGDAYDPAPSRPFLALGLSDNVSYTFDESRAWGDRVTSITMNGVPMDPAKLYTVGSGSFLISGGDNFWAFRNGVNTADTGRVDLEAWVDWIRGQDALVPDYSKRGVSLTGAVSTLTQGAAPVQLTLGEPLAGGLQTDTLDMFLDASGARVSPQLANTAVTAYIGDEIVGGGTVTDGVATVNVAVAHGADVAAGANTLDLVVEPSGTVVSWPVNVKLTTEPTTPTPPVDVYTTPGLHKVNDRLWMTACESYSSQVDRCWTWIWGTTVHASGGHYVQINGWNFNNLTYIGGTRAHWTSNPLGHTNRWVSDGRNWRTECDTALSGGNGCRSFVESSVIERQGNSYRVVTKEVFNNMVRFS